jgi:hypothetical protein
MHGQSSQQLLATKLGTSSDDQVPNDGVIMYNVKKLMAYTFGHLKPD